MARKLRPEEARAFDEKPDVEGPQVDLEKILHEPTDQPDGGFDLSAIDPVWIKRSLPDPLG